MVNLAKSQKLGYPPAPEQAGALSNQELLYGIFLYPPTLRDALGWAGGPALACRSMSS